MLSVADQVKRSSAYNIASPINQNNQFTELNTEGLPEGKEPIEWDLPPLWESCVEVRVPKLNSLYLAFN